ncbi:hypothetical protein AMJ39_07700 [candidate division TA06 bacterium DG_24]|uniref:Xylose isomerase-like TIM barrel domain-containing protein n=3 Tax=Bacteria division TA06 TaxID=1156500 RepID=A0A0S8JNG8_UNCT6|nr:MAG: hypothetical protein AMJ39_07700 [candidate division TA06 bacterium DG_24]KPK70290.1 MAG: hypothetical protein AMJ82_03535 [candidate division TA06 bacterium SM23_40]KPL10755.1 MAG: hypothetical protein AMJ71_02090 [candidate division TA06 bacterium SM1_40]
MERRQRTTREDDRAILRTIRRRLGYQALFDVPDVEAAIDLAVQSKLSAVELNMNAPHFYPERYPRGKRRELRRRAEDGGVVLLLHANEEIDLCSFREEIRCGSIELVARTIEFAVDLGALRVTIHPGRLAPLFGVEGRYVSLFEKYPGGFANSFRDSIMGISPFLDPRVDVCFENVGPFHDPITHPLLEELWASVDIYLAWDLGHTHLLQRRDPDRGELEQRFFRRHLDRVRNCHVHDNDGKRDSHDVIGRGTADIRSYLELLAGTQTWFIFEVRPHERALECLRVFESWLEP